MGTGQAFGWLSGLGLLVVPALMAGVPATIAVVVMGGLLLVGTIVA